MEEWKIESILIFSRYQENVSGTKFIDQAYAPILRVQMNAVEDNIG